MDKPPASRDLWLAAGQELLRRGGARAVKLHPLAAEAGLTTGSFYHHFASIGGFLEELADHYGSDFPQEIIGRAAAADPLERLRRIRDASLEERVGVLDAAMRDWAGADERAAKAVGASDERLLDFVVDAFVDLGHDQAAARLRALVLVGLGVSRVRPSWRLDGTEFDRTLALLAPLDP